MRNSVVVFPLWAALISSCALFNSHEADLEIKEPSLEVGDRPAMAPAIETLIPAVEPVPGPASRNWGQDEIRRMQTRLREVGLDPGPADGVVGARTRAAFNKFHAGCGQIQAVLDTLENGAAIKATVTHTTERQETVAIQTRLQRAGFNPGPVDGVLGARTKALLTELQRGCPLAKDFAQFLAQPLGAAQPSFAAQVGERANVVSAPSNNSSRARLDAVKPTVTVAAGSQEEIRILQLRLRDAGFDPGPFDGVMGPKTLSALQQLQASQRAGKTRTSLALGIDGHY